MGDALNAFAKRWRINGDWMQCQCCERPQQVSWMLHPFQHAAGCKMADLPGQQPWVEFRSLLGAALSRARPPHA